MSGFTIFDILHWFKPYSKVCRVESWLTWVFGFSLGNVLLSVCSFSLSVTVFIAFSLATSSIFVLNQYFDLQLDKRNNLKSDLPIASGQISSKGALIFSFLLIGLCFTLVSMTNFYLSLSILLYLTLWTLYSAPYPKLKAIPILDFLTSGIGAGFFPFFIGLNTTPQPNINVSLIMLPAIPLTFFHCGAHIIQTIGDYEADRDAGINTFVVRYGKKKGVTVAGLMFLLALLLAFACLFSGLISSIHIFFFILLLPFTISPFLRFKHLYNNPCTSSVLSFQKSVKKYGIPLLLIAWVYTLITKYLITGL